MPRTRPDITVPDLSGRRAVVSGASDGVGLALAGRLAAAPEIGRTRPAPQRRLVQAPSRRGILYGTVDTALLPAPSAATSPDARGERMCGPDGFGNISGAPAEQTLYRPLRSTEDAARIRRLSEEPAKLSFAASAPRSLDGRRSGQ